MARGGKLATNDQIQQMFQSKKKGRDESDEAQFDESEDEYHCSLASDEIGESSEKFGEEKHTKKVKRVRRPIERGRNGTIGKKNAAYVVENGGPKGKKKPRKETNVLYRKEGEDSDTDDSDEEFRPDEVDGDEELSAMVKEAKGTERKKQKRKLKNFKRTGRKKPKKEHPIRETRCPVKESRDSDLEYTISEEEREQIREAAEICKSLTTDLRSSYLKTIREEEKEKEETVDIKSKLGKLVCGICLSEEGKRRARGTLNCCSHYFCFACIMEWSKVESRCPLCKKRFQTISKTAQVVGEHNSRDVIIQVPERDQVYQPSMEELTGYLDPYEDAVCSECGQGGDDALMLLCDLCDSAAHTYCVGLGREVPEGNWYCAACRTILLASSNANSSPAERFDRNELSESDTPYCESTLPSVSPRYYVGVSQTPPPPPSGLVPLTVSERRRIQQQIHLILMNRSDRNATTVDMTPHNFHQRGRLPYYAAPSFLPPTSRLFHHGASTSTSSYGWNHHHSGMSNSRGPQKEQVQSMVRSHLKNLSRDFYLGYERFKYIARRSTHTILAALGMEHRRSQVCGVQTRALVCSHLHCKWAFAGVQCYSCLDIFIRSVVREIMFILLPP